MTDLDSSDLVWIKSAVRLCLSALDLRDEIEWGNDSTFDKLATWTEYSPCPADCPCLDPDNPF